MSLRRHVHLLLQNHKKRAYSLHLLKRDHLFYPTEEEAAAKARALPRLRKVPPFSPLGTVPRRKKNQAALSDRLESVRLSPAVFTVRPSPCPTACNAHARVEFFPLSGSKIFFTDSGARTAFFDTEARCMITTPNLHSPKHCHPVVVSVPNPGSEGEQDGGDHSLYIMDTLLDPCNASPFEALIYRKLLPYSAVQTWHCDTLPLPPFLSDRPHRRRVSISSHSVVGDVICVSVDGSGTHCFDTVSRTWSLAGDWQMPFYGKAEYVPELKLWLGLSAANLELPCAADLSPVLRGHEPKRRYVWGDPHLPKEWLPASYGSSNIISFGSGRFCITNFYEDMNNIVMDGQGGPVGETIVVFTGLEVLPGKESGSDMGKDKSDGKGNGLRMIKHKSCTIAQTNFIQSIL